jgi:hypothetical protein
MDWRLGVSGGDKSDESGVWNRVSKLTGVKDVGSRSIQRGNEQRYHVSIASRRPMLQAIDYHLPQLVEGPFLLEIAQAQDHCHPHILGQLLSPAAYPPIGLPAQILHPPDSHPIRRMLQHILEEIS